MVIADLSRDFTSLVPLHAETLSNHSSTFMSPKKTAGRGRGRRGVKGEPEINKPEVTAQHLPPQPPATYKSVKTWKCKPFGAAQEAGDVTIPRHGRGRGRRDNELGRLASLPNEDDAHASRLVAHCAPLQSHPPCRGVPSTAVPMVVQAHIASRLQVTCTARMFTCRAQATAIVKIGGLLRDAWIVASYSTVGFRANETSGGSFAMGGALTSVFSGAGAGEGVGAGEGSDFSAFFLVSGLSSFFLDSFEATAEEDSFPLGAAI
jgi:hypothetical protein